MMSATAFAAVMFPSCAARPVSLLVLTGRTITGALMVEPASLRGRVCYPVSCCVLRELRESGGSEPAAECAAVGGFLAAAAARQVRNQICLALALARSVVCVLARQVYELR